MILADTNILGTLARVERLELLLNLFGQDELGVCPAVYAELLAGIREGRRFLQPAVNLVEQGTIKLVALTADEILGRQKLPGSLDSGEAESITVCRTRGAAFLTNDRRARNFCLAEGIEVFDLVDMLRALWKLRVRSKREVSQLVKDIENREGLVFKHKERIFAK
jgi:predicted nucleic acid-binding protein